MGAWIETLRLLDLLGYGESHPMWVRGLKQLDSLCPVNIVTVAPHVGAWIETSIPQENVPCHPSHPMWVRGLKRLNL